MYSQTPTWDTRFVHPEPDRCWFVNERSLHSLIEQLLRFGHTIAFEINMVEPNVLGYGETEPFAPIFKLYLHSVAYSATPATTIPLSYLDIIISRAIESAGHAKVIAQGSWFWMENDSLASQLGSFLANSDG